MKSSIHPHKSPKARIFDFGFAVVSYLTALFDYGLNLKNFFKVHRRLPRRSGGGLNDALFFIKTSDEIRDPVRVFVSDKVLVKEYVKAKLGDSCNVGTIAVLDSYEEALHFSYPSDCVIKPTHLSAKVIFRQAGSPIDFDQMRGWFDTNYYFISREANYRYLRPRIIVEPYIFNRTGVDDYKIFCLHGRPLIVQVDLGRHTHHTRNFYTVDWELLPFALGSPLGKGTARPENLKQLLEAATKLSEEFNLIRIDLYTDGRNVLLGEITNCHGGGQERFMPPEGEAIMTHILFGEAGFSCSNLRNRRNSEKKDRHAASSSSLF